MKMMAIVFLPFITKYVFYSTLHEILQPYGLNTNVFIDLPASVHTGLHRFRVFMGDLSVHRLTAFTHFLNESCGTNFAPTNYECMVVIGMCNGDLADIPMSAFPWPSRYFAVDCFPRCFGSNSADAASHSLLSSCGPCRSLKKRCVPNGLLACLNCAETGRGCTVHPRREMYARRREYARITRDAIDLLCPLYQYIINVFLRKQETHLFSSRSMALLNTLMDSMVFTPVPPSMTIPIERYDAFQVSRYHRGVLSIVRQRGMDRFFGFEVSSSKTLCRLDKIAAISPHLGMATPISAYSFIDNALSSPGDIIMVDMEILTKQMRFAPVCIRMIANVVSKEDIVFTMSWELKN